MNTSSSIHQSKSTRRLSLIILITLITPSFYGFLGLSAGQMMLLFALLGFMLYMGLTKGVRVDFRQLAPVAVPMIVLSVLYAVTISMANVIVDSPSMKDFFDILRPLIYLTYFVIAISLLGDKPDINVIMRNLVIYLLIITVLDFLKFQQTFGTSAMKLYTMFKYMSINYLRFSGTFCFCYNYGFMLILPLFYMLYNKNFNRRYLYVILFAVFIIATGSRSVILAFFVCLTLYFMFMKAKIYKKFFIFISVFGLLTITYLLIKDIDSPLIRATVGYVENMVEALLGEGGDSSLSARNSQLDYAMESMARNPIFGVGPQKGTGEPIEIMLGYYLSSWGILGLTCFLFIVATFFYFALVTSSSNSPTISAFSKANMLWIVALFFVGMSTPIIDQIRVSNIFYLMQGVQFYLYIQSKNEKPKYISNVLQ